MRDRLRIRVSTPSSHENFLADRSLRQFLLHRYSSARVRTRSDVNTSSRNARLARSHSPFLRRHRGRERLAFVLRAHFVPSLQRTTLTWSNRWKRRSFVRDEGSFRVGFTSGTERLLFRACRRVSLELLSSRSHACNVRCLYFTYSIS